MHHAQRRRHGWSARIVLVVTSLALVLSACGSDSKSGGGTTTSPGGSGGGGGKPQSGGKLTMAIESETGGGYCLPDAQLVVSGEQVATSIYDTLVTMNSKGEYVPFLAESVTPNADSTVWTIKLRSGIKFHDNSPLNADVVKNNIDAWRGAYANRPSLLLSFVASDVATVTSDGNLTVTVTTKRPWTALPWVLYANGRTGIMAQAQLDASPEDCKSKTLIGTGPFKFVSWTPNVKLELTRNPDYWRKDKYGTQLPYLDAITFVPQPNEQQRNNGLATGQFQVVHQSNQIQVEELLKGGSSGKYNVAQETGHRELRYYLTNARRAPFNDQTGREALAYAIDRETVNQIVNLGKATLADQPFDKDVVGFNPKTKFPEYNLATAKKKVAAYKQAHGGSFPQIVFLCDNSPAELKEATELVNEVEAAGIPAKLKQVDQTKIVDTALGGDFDVMLWRNHPGGDPDSQYFWWWNTPSDGKASQAGNPINFGAFADDEISNDLETGRGMEVGSAARAKNYQGLAQDFADKLWNVWGWYINWTIGAKTNVYGLTGGTLPDGSAPIPILAGLIRADNLWIKR